MEKNSEDIWKEMNNSIDQHIIHFKEEVNNKECDKRKFLRILSCPICSYIFTLKFMSNNKDMEEFQDVEGLYETDQELEKYIKENKEHIIKHNLIKRYGE